MASAPLPPGRSGLPLLGEMLGFVRDPFAFFEERYKKYGPVFRTRLLADDVVCLVGEAFEKIYDEEVFTRANGSPPHVRELFHRDAIPFLSGAAQRRRRTLLMAAFTPEALQGYRPLVRRVIDRYLQRWADEGEVSAVAELSNMSFTIANVLFAAGDPERDTPELAEAFLTFGAGVFALPIKLPVTAFGRALAARDRLREHVARAVARPDEPDAAHVLARLRAARDGEEALSEEELRIEMLHFFFAAHGGVQGASANLLRALAEHPEVCTRARAAVDADDPAYITRVTKEVRRTSKIAPTTFFAVVKKDAEILGHTVKKGWKAVGVIHTTQQSVEHPTSFDPDRFEDDQPRYVAHGTGPWTGHRCAGEALADLVLSELCFAALSGYTWSLPEQDLAEVPGGFAPMPRDGLRLRWQPRA